MRDMECKMEDGSFVMVSDLPLPLILATLADPAPVFEEDSRGTTLADVTLRLEIEVIRRREGW